ncbi:MAG: MarR family transcriptional regulator [Candidatus Omnitrophica bacterium]|nr:MarR family transcriptional regulator [Candidatus Omnitrophota bacterium]
MDMRKFARELAALIPQIHSEFLRRQPQELLKGRMTFAQMIILDFLYMKGESKMGDVSRAMGVTKSAVTGLTDRLIKVGFLRRFRSLNDRRIVRITLSKRGSAVARRLAGYKLKMIGTLFSNISQKERRQYLGILKKLQKNLDRKRTK